MTAALCILAGVMIGVGLAVAFGWGATLAFVGYVLFRWAAAGVEE